VALAESASAPTWARIIFTDAVDLRGVESLGEAGGANEGVGYRAFGEFEFLGDDLADEVVRERCVSHGFGPPLVGSHEIGATAPGRHGDPEGGGRRVQQGVVLPLDHLVGLADEAIRLRVLRPPLLDEGDASLVGG
jgi:hypothetical protein